MFTPKDIYVLSKRYICFSIPISFKIFIGPDKKKTSSGHGSLFLKILYNCVVKQPRFWL